MPGIALVKNDVARPSLLAMNPALLKASRQGSAAKEKRRREEGWGGVGSGDKRNEWSLDDIGNYPGFLGWVVFFNGGKTKKQKNKKCSV